MNHSYRLVAWGHRSIKGVTFFGPFATQDEAEKKRIEIEKNKDVFFVDMQIKRIGSEKWEDM